MILRTITMTFDTETPIHGPPVELRKFFTTKFAEFTGHHNEETGSFIHRYPVVQCKMIKNIPTVIGINEGAVFLKEFADKSREIQLGLNTYRIAEHDLSIREEPFGISDTIQGYEFVTPWLALSQENYKKFYKLTGKPARDEFVQKKLVDTISTLSKSLGCNIAPPIICDTNLHFQKERFDGVSVMAFTGKFQVNFQIPEYLGIGRSVSFGYGTVRRIFKDIKRR
ncbi:MAG TPA: CRISPR-associated endonuclease Cas6 [Methanoregula sp.]|nr:CRISPR-associated endonuclease Cas6 [Methanoregula sp.]